MASQINGVDIVLAWIVVAVVAVRVEHLIASDIWMLVRGRQWARDMSALTPAQRADPDHVATVLRRHGGWSLPWLFFGIKSTKLDAAVRRAESADQLFRARLYGLIRVLWRFYVLPPLVAVTIIAMTLNGAPMQLALPLWVTACLLLIGCAAVIAEAGFATLTMGAWAVWHRQRDRASTHADSDGHRLWEYLFFFGVAALIYVPCGMAALCAADAAFGTYAQLLAADPIDRLVDALVASASVLGFQIPQGSGIGSLTGVWMLGVTASFVFSTLVVGGVLVSSVRRVEG
ncbi:hypothetical protein [Microbacterium sp. C7(2022)]|uniref:hypothetical protein n=1 Tax=Microbacterium sp. C7(2022) TaxID=2992759 RepID=UPI00237BB180|nr:hypothetical protein [Microbacterium sp. C7(2022)]MDE0545380.1 hypothetical protein [Microbacterium sp. C7(2022)]